MNMPKNYFSYKAPNGEWEKKPFTIRSDKGETYRVRISYRDEMGKFKQKELDTKVRLLKSNYREALKSAERIAREWYEGYESERQVKQFKKQYMGHLKINDYCDFYLQEVAKRKRSNTAFSYDAHLKRARKYLANISMKDVDRAVIDRFVELLIDENHEIELAIKKGDKSRRTFSNSFKKIVNALVTMVKFAYDRGDNNHVDALYISRSSLDLMKKLYSKPDFVPLTSEELDKLLKFIEGDPLEIAVRLAAMNGLRREEVLGLKWAHVNLDEEYPTIKVKDTIVKVGQKTEERIGEAKNKSSLREIPMMLELDVYLRKLKEQQANDKKTLGRAYIDNDYVFKFADGSRPRPDWISRNFLKHSRECGIRNTRFHDLRHYTATYIIRKTGDIKFAQEILGHSSIQTTMDIYTNLSKRDLVEKAMTYKL